MEHKTAIWNSEGPWSLTLFYEKVTSSPSYAVVPVHGSGQLRIFNGLPCLIELDPPINGQSTIPPLGALQVNNVEVVNGTRTLTERLKINAQAPFLNTTIEPTNWTEDVVVFEAKSTSYLVTILNDRITLRRIPGHDDVTKSPSNAPRVRVISNFDAYLTLRNQYDSEFHFSLSGADQVTTLDEVYSGSYKPILNGRILASNFLLESGGVYTIVLQKFGTKFTENLHIITPPATLHMIWTFPQIFVVTMAEIFFVVTYLSFSFTEAPESMKIFDDFCAVCSQRIRQPACCHNFKYELLP
nr:PREDICTED: peptide transporter family 1-like [Bemisia tabaci]